MAAHTPAFHDRKLITETEYLASDFEVDPDFVNGHLQERFVGGIEHSPWQRALMFWFAQNTTLLAASEIHVRFAEGNHRIPDVAVFLEPPQDTYVTEPPLAVFEILRPSDTFRRLKERMRDYQKMGVKNLFVIESRTEFSEFKENKFIPILEERTELVGSDGFIVWHEAANLLWPNDAACIP